MNLFKKYGIKEVADVTFYSILEVGNEEFYIPILVLDTLKVSTIEQKSSPVTANGSYGNQKLIAWNFGKEISLKLEDALFSAASLNMTYGWLNSKLSLYTSLITKINMANKYAQLHYSTYAYPSPELTNEEWETLYFIVSNLYGEDEDTVNKELCNEIRSAIWNNEITYEIAYDAAPHITKDFINEPYVSEWRTKIREAYKFRQTIDGAALPKNLIKLIYNQIQNVSDYYVIDTDNYELEVIDRMERCVVVEDDGLVVDFGVQWDNLQKYFNNNKYESYTIYYDPKTMQPLAMATSGTVEKTGTCTLKKGTVYYKWSRTVQQKIDDKDFLGKTLILSADTFPQNFKIVGETYIREQKTNKDSRYQFVIHKAKISTDTNITLQADGDPTTFSMNIDVLVPPNEIMMELRQFDVTEDEEHGGTKILPQETEYTRTNTSITTLKEDGDIENNEIY